MILEALFLFTVHVFAEPPKAVQYCKGNFVPQKVAQDQPYELNHPDENQKFDLYVPKGAKKPYRTIVLIHGGCFQYGDKADGEKEYKRGEKIDPMSTYNQILKYVKAGYAVASINYRKAKPDPEDPSKSVNTYPTALNDVRDAWCYLQNNGYEKYGLDTDQMAVSGHSAGSTLSIMAGLNHTSGDGGHNPKCKPHAGGAIGMSGRAIFTERTEDKIPEHQKGLDCGEGFAGVKRNQPDAQEIFQNMNLLTHVDPKTAPPVHLTYGTADTLVNPKNSKALCAALGAKCEAEPIEGANHMYDGPDDMDRAFESNCKFLSTKVFGPNAVETARSGSGVSR